MANKRKSVKKRIQYEADDMVKALKAVEDGMKIQAASKLFKVPRMTLSDKVRRY